MANKTLFKAATDLVTNLAGDAVFAPLPGGWVPQAIALRTNSPASNCSATR